MSTAELGHERGVASDAKRVDVTVFIPTFNRPDYLDPCIKRTLESLGEQGLDFEILLCDDASDPATGEVARAWQRRDPRVRVVRHERNLGAYGNTLYGLRHARGRFTVNLSDDDMLIAETVAEFVRIFDENTNVVMIQAPFFIMSEYQRNKITGMLYTLEDPVLVRKRDFKSCIELIVRRRIFPESYAIRTDAIPEIILPPGEISWMYFVNLTRALHEGDVLFVPTPFQIVSIACHDQHLGARDCAMGWDWYRGGLEHLLGYARASSPEADWREAEDGVRSVVLDRMAAAMKLHVYSRRWYTAWMLHRRLLAYGVRQLAPDVEEELLSLAAMDSVLQEAKILGAAEVVLDDAIYALFLNACDLTRLDMPVHCRMDWVGPRRGRIAHVGMHLARTSQHHVDDLVIDLAAAMRRITP